MVGELTASTPILVTGGAAIKTAVDNLALAAVTDFIMIIPIIGSNNQYYVFKIERA